MLSLVTKDIHGNRSVGIHGLWLWIEGDIQTHSHGAVQEVLVKSTQNSNTKFRRDHIFNRPTEIRIWPVMSAAEIRGSCQVWSRNHPQVYRLNILVELRSPFPYPTNPERSEIWSPLAECILNSSRMHWTRRAHIFNVETSFSFWRTRLTLSAFSIIQIF